MTVFFSQFCKKAVPTRYWNVLFHCSLCFLLPFRKLQHQCTEIPLYRMTLVSVRLKPEITHTHTQGAKDQYTVRIPASYLFAWQLIMLKDDISTPHCLDQVTNRCMLQSFLSFRPNRSIYSLFSQIWYIQDMAPYNSGVTATYNRTNASEVTRYIFNEKTFWLTKGMYTRQGPCLYGLYIWHKSTWNQNFV